MAKRTMKVLDLFLDDGRQIICIRDYMAKCNEYKVYYRWYDCGWHKRKLAEYADMRSVLAHLLQESYN